MSKEKFPREAALEVARAVYAALKDDCERIKVAGSLRRGLKTVSDIEFLCIPKIELRSTDLFDSEKEKRDLLSDKLDCMVKWGQLKKRLSATGNETWGAQNKLAVHVASGIPIDFFTTTAENWWMALAIRTGPKESNIRIAVAAKKKGWAMNAYGSGFTEPDGTKHICESEEDVFTGVGLPYYPPERRR